MNNKLIAAGVLIAIIVVAGFLASSALPSVEAYGQASIKAQPDEISIYAVIETKNDTLQEAQKANSEIRERIVDALLDMGIDEKDIQFSNYYSGVWADWENGKYREKGYQVSQTIVVKTANFQRTPRIVDVVIESGGLVQSIQFEISQEKQNEYKSEVLKIASENAKQKAEAIAEGQGRGLGRLVSLNSEEPSYGPYPYYMAKEGVAASDAAAEARQSASFIAPQEQEVNAAVRVEYKLSFF